MADSIVPHEEESIQNFRKNRSYEHFFRELRHRQCPDLGEINLICSSGGTYGPVSLDIMTRAFLHVVEASDDDDNFENNEQERLQIHRINFSKYNFYSLPERVIGQAYSNLAHVDIRENSELRCIGAIVKQLPNLMSLNLCDCPNLKTIVPLAHILPAKGSTTQLRLKHLWVRECNLSHMLEDEWDGVFRALSLSSGPLERLALSRNQMTFLPSSIVNVGHSLTYLFADDNFNMEIPDVIGSMSKLRYISLSGNGLTKLPPTICRLRDDCTFHIGRNSNLVCPPKEFQHSLEKMKIFFHMQRMKQLRGVIKLIPLLKRAQLRANERLFEPGGSGFLHCKKRFKCCQKQQEHEN